MTRRIIVLLAFALFMSAGAAPRSLKGPMAFNIEVPLGKHKAVRIQNLPKSTVVSLQVATDGEVLVAFLDRADCRRFARASHPLLRGRVDSRFRFSVTIPDSGNYFVVLTNGSKEEKRAVSVGVAAMTEEGAGRAQETLARFQQQLDRIFIFERISIYLERCEKRRSFSEAEGVGLCEGFIRKLNELVPDRSQATNVLLFMLFHQVGHRLLDQWEIPYADSEDLADEFAAVLMVILGQRDRIRDAAELFGNSPSLAKSFATAFEDDHAGISDERLGNMLRWADDSKLAYRWQWIFIPRMENAILEHLSKNSPSWIDPELLEKELADRR